MSLLSLTQTIYLCSLASLLLLNTSSHWKVEKSWYRQASAAVIALAVCCLHFLGMLSVTYIADSSQNVGECSRKDFQGWRPDQIKVLMVAMTVPFISFFIEHTISNELRQTYRQLLDIRLTGSQFMDPKSRVSGASQYSCVSTFNGSSTRGISVFASRGFTKARPSTGRNNVKISGLECSEADSTSLSGAGSSHRRRISVRSADSENFWNMLHQCAEEVKAEQSAAMSMDDDSSSGELAEEGRQGEESEGKGQLQPAGSTSMESEFSNEETERQSQEDEVVHGECSPSGIHYSPKTISTLSTVTPSSERCIDLEIGTGNDMEIRDSTYLSDSHNIDQVPQSDMDIPNDSESLERFRGRDSLSLQGVLDDISGSSLSNSHSTRPQQGPPSRRGMERRYRSAGNVLEMSHPTTGDVDASSCCLQPFTPKPNTLQAFCDTWPPTCNSRQSLPPTLNQQERHQIATESA